MNKIIILSGILFFVFLFSGCIGLNENGDVQTNKETPYPNPPFPTPTHTPTPTLTPAGSIDIEYSTQKMDKRIAYMEYIYPPQGMQFILFDFKVTNKGIKRILVNEFTWSLSANTIENPGAYLSMERNFSDSGNIPCINAELDKNGYASCQVIWEIPINYGNFKVYYEGGGSTPINWIYLGEK